MHPALPLQTRRSSLSCWSACVFICARGTTASAPSKPISTGRAASFCFMGKRHPQGMGAIEVEAFLSHLAVDRQVSASTRNQAKAALLYFVPTGAGYRFALAVRGDGVQAGAAFGGARRQAQPIMRRLRRLAWHTARLSDRRQRRNGFFALHRYRNAARS